MGNVTFKTSQGEYTFDASLIVGMLEHGEDTIVTFEDGDKIVVNEPFNQVYSDWQDAGGD